MATVFKLAQIGTHLWGRPIGVKARQQIEQLLGEAPLDGALIVDMLDVEVMDYSFSSEVFGKLFARLSKEYTGKHMILENLSEYVKENLEPALKDLKLSALVLQDNNWFLIGNTKNTDLETLRALEELKATDLSTLAQKLGITVNACSNRLNKLAELGLIGRLEVERPVGNEKYLYSWVL